MGRLLKIYIGFCGVVIAGSLLFVVIDIDQWLFENPVTTRIRRVIKRKPIG